MRTLCFALAWLGLAAPARAQPQWYAADELVDTLRPGERASVARQAQLGAASELPLYDLTVDVADDLRPFRDIDALSQPGPFSFVFVQHSAPRAKQQR